MLRPCVNTSSRSRVKNPSTCQSKNKRKRKRENACAHTHAHGQQQLEQAAQRAVVRSVLVEVTNGSIYSEAKSEDYLMFSGEMHFLLQKKNN